MQLYTTTQPHLLASPPSSLHMSTPPPSCSSSSQRLVHYDIHYNTALQIQIPLSPTRQPTSSRGYQELKNSSLAIKEKNSDKNGSKSARLPSKQRRHMCAIGILSSPQRRLQVVRHLRNLAWDLVPSTGVTSRAAHHNRKAVSSSSIPPRLTILPRSHSSPSTSSGLTSPSSKLTRSSSRLPRAARLATSLSL